MKNKTMKETIEQFKSLMNRQDNPRVFYAPGRVNLIGEHIDYNGGLVFPAAISIGTYGLVLKRNDRQIHLYSNNYPDDGLFQIDLDHLIFDPTHGWTNYVKGILDALIKKGHKIETGFDLLVDGNLPTASGLSSSASLEVLVAYIAKTLFNLTITRTELAVLSQDVENNYMGMHCGIMDQLIIARGVKDKALLMNTATLEVEENNAVFEGYQWIIMNTKYQRKTTDSKYNQRRSECEMALSHLKSKFNIEYLCDISIENLGKVRSVIKDDLIFRRAKHVISEQNRVIQSKIAMDQKDVHSFANLLNQSHQSLKEDFEVTGFHLDTLCEAARANGALGARVTGAGFGGCAIALVKSNQVKKMEETVRHIYFEKTQLEAEFYEVTFEDGVHEVNLNGN